MLTEYVYRCPVVLEMQSALDGEPYEIDGTPERAAEIQRLIETDSFWGANQAEYICGWNEEDRRVENALIDVRFGVTYDQDRLWGVAHVTTNRPLTTNEEEIVMDGITGQFSDGWGESFEQTEIRGKTPYSEYYCHFWQYDNWELERI